LLALARWLALPGIFIHGMPQGEKRQMPRPTDATRNAEICRLREEGKPLEVIARMFDLSLERARQIVRQGRTKVAAKEATS
jgi:DNA-binding CsgD family transcriptional regulator